MFCGSFQLNYINLTILWLSTRSKLMILVFNFHVKVLKWVLKDRGTLIFRHFFQDFSSIKTISAQVLSFPSKFKSISWDTFSECPAATQQNSLLFSKNRHENNNKFLRHQFVWRIFIKFFRYFLCSALGARARRTEFLVMERFLCVVVVSKKAAAL